MSETAKHTPGPWAIKHLHGLKADAFNITARNGEWTICMGPNWFPEHAEENSANARLIAAAPGLLAEISNAAVALEEAGKLLAAAQINGTPMKGTASIMATHAERCRTAIAAATGGK